ncbi:MAG: type II toxin-antitoxin system RelE/ParE family toxin [Pseudomonadota bacterium]
MKVKLYRSDRGRSPVEEFIDGLPKRDQARFLGALLGIEAEGFQCAGVGFRKLHGKLWEMKLRTEGGAYRIAYVVVPGGLMVWLHAFKKKTQKTDLNDLRLAERRMKEVLNA